MKLRFTAFLKQLLTTFRQTGHFLQFSHLKKNARTPPCPARQRDGTMLTSRFQSGLIIIQMYGITQKNAIINRTKPIMRIKTAKHLTTLQIAVNP